MCGAGKARDTLLYGAGAVSGRLLTLVSVRLVGPGLCAVRVRSGTAPLCVHLLQSVGSGHPAD
jgi:hypothetical protein